jgi:hypothetical protein
LAQPATRTSGAHPAVKKQEEGFSIPTPLIIAIACIGVVFVLVVLLMMIFGSPSDETVAVAPRHAMPQAPQQAVNSEQANPTPPTDVAGPAGASVQQQASPTVSDQGSPQPVVENTQPAEVTSLPVVQPAPSDSGPVATQAAEPEKADTAPANIETPPDQSNPSPAPSQAQAPPQPSVNAADVASAAPSAAEVLSEAERKELWETIESISLELDVPGPLARQKPGLRGTVAEKLGKFKIEDGAPAVLHVSYQVEPPAERNPAAKVPYSVAIKLTVTDKSGQKRDIWTDEMKASEPFARFQDEMRKDAAGLVAKMINTLGRP